MDQRLKDRLPQLSLSTLHQMDHGKLHRQFGRCLGRVIENIVEFPMRNGKPECREITLRLIVTPEVKLTKKPIENAWGTSEIDVPEIVGLTVKAVIKDKLPIFESADVSMATDVKNGRIVDVRFNPQNSHNPGQLELEFDGQPLADDPGDDDDGDEADD